MKLARLASAIKALRYLGPTQVALNARYRFGLLTGHYRRAILPPAQLADLKLRRILPEPDREKVLATIAEPGLRTLLAEADQILAGNFDCFGAGPAPINLVPPPPLLWWTDYENGKAHHPGDIKFAWEPARFGWAFILGRAFYLTADDRYAAAFWHYFEEFCAANPPYQGPNWTSGQEVGLRLIAFTWAGQIFGPAKSATPARLLALAQAVATHAARIPDTLVYARSQNNNHLLTEAAALYTAGWALADHPLAPAWRSLGRKWLSWCLRHQIDPAGEYVQHSTNYHRLMLQTLLWVSALENIVLPVGSSHSGVIAENHAAIASAARWLLTLLDPLSGQVPNLGAHDGALIMPLSSSVSPADDGLSSISDYRPVAQAAACAFLSASLEPGPWDEMALWFGLNPPQKSLSLQQLSAPRLQSRLSSGYLRAISYTSRPSHADQLHFDLSFRGFNIARDAGTYLYNGEPPWDNQLTSTLIHNTVSIDGMEQMQRASRFLYLDWSDARYLDPIQTNPAGSQALSARLKTYSTLNIRHDRHVDVSPDDTWSIKDELDNPGRHPHVYRLHWLLIDFPWQIQMGDTTALITLQSPYGAILIDITSSLPLTRVGIIRAGQLVYGSALPSPTFGWVSLTYSIKRPALSLAVEVQSEKNVTFTSRFTFPH